MSDYKEELARIEADLARAKRTAAERGTLGGTVENGTRILALSRTFGDDVAELRVYLQEYKSHPVVQLGTWRGDEAGRWFIERDRQCRVRRSELVHVIKALLRIVRILDGEEQPWDLPGAEAEDSTLRCWD